MLLNHNNVFCLRRNRKAQSMVEFILVVLPFLLLLMGILQLLHIAVVKVLINHSAFTAARVAVINDRLDYVTYAVRQAFPLQDKLNISVEILSKIEDSEVEVNVTYKMALIFPFISKIIKEAKNLPDYNLPVQARYSLPKENFLN